MYNISALLLTYISSINNSDIEEWRNTHSSQIYVDNCLKFLEPRLSNFSRYQTHPEGLL